MCWWYWLPPDDAWGWWTLFLPGASSSQDMSDCELWICSLHSAPLKCENPLRQDFLAGVLAVVVRRRLLCSPGPNIARPSSNKSHIFFSKWWYNSLCTTHLLKALPSDMYDSRYHCDFVTTMLSWSLKNYQAGREAPKQENMPSLL